MPKNHLKSIKPDFDPVFFDLSYWDLFEQAHQNFNIKHMFTFIQNSG